MTEMTIGDCRMSVVRHDFCGEFSIELFVPHDRAVDIWRHLTQGITPPRLTPVGDQAVQIRRIEAGLAWAGHEITDEYLPAEIDPGARAVSYQKGCYLGQEVVERMRSRGVVARRLVGLHFGGDAVPNVPLDLLGPDGKPVGRLTSACRRLDTPPNIGLAVVKVAAAAPGASVSAAWDDRRAVATVDSLPFRPAAAQ
jgi:folate-binding protein YgfZ